jgi:hypothetical protein
VPAVGDVLETVPAVGDFLVLGQHIGDVREQPLVAVQRLAERIEAGLALCLVPVGEKVERALEVQLLAIDLELQRRHRLVEQPVPGRGAGHRLLVEQLLDLVVELVGLGLAQFGEPRPVAAERRIGRKAPLDHRIVDAVEFQPQKNEAGRQIGQRLVHVAEELGAGRVLRVPHILQEGIGAEPAGDVVQRFDPADDRLSSRPDFASPSSLPL